MNGQVVRAQGGHRSEYRPLQSKLCASAEPQDVLAGILQLYDFSDIYVADLDAIRGAAPQVPTLTGLSQAFPHVCFWLDAGLRVPADLNPWRDTPGLRYVLGSESLASISAYHALAANIRASQSAESRAPILSLDTQCGGQLGPPELFLERALWMQDLIAMNLDAVGGGQGPDLTGIRRWRQLAPEYRLYAAGGVRGLEDLRSLQAEGVAGALVATALHDGSIEGGDLRHLGTQDAGTSRK